MTSSTIELFLVFDDPNRLRLAEFLIWSVKAIAAPRTDLDALLQRDEVQKSGVYILAGEDPESGNPAAYVGEAEVLKDRIRQHRERDFWNRVVVVLSKDENLTKAHVKHLEGRLIDEGQRAGRFVMLNTQGSGAKLPESDRADMEVFLSKIRQLLPLLGLDLVTPILSSNGPEEDVGADLSCTIKGLVARGRRTPSGFVVFCGSQAVGSMRPSAQKRGPWVVALRTRLIDEGSLEAAGDHMRFKKNVEFASPSAAASIVHGGHANGLIAWRDSNGPR